MKFDDEIEKLPPLKNENIEVGILPNNQNDDTTNTSNVVNTSTTNVVENTAHIDTTIKKDEVVFRVQIKISDKPLDIKEEKPLKNIWYYMTGNLIKYTSGKFYHFEDAQTHLNELKNNGYKDAFIVAFKNGERISLEEAKKLSSGKGN